MLNEIPVFTVVEQFLSLEGEAAYTNRPTVYTRFANCNFKCPGFNNEGLLLGDTGYAKLTFDPKKITRMQDVPLITRGCDSQYATSKEFSHLWQKMTAAEVIQGVLDLLPGKTWTHPKTGLSYIYSITGGEPLMHWKTLPDILVHPLLDDCKHIIFETNGAVPVKSSFYESVESWVGSKHNRTWTWSVSPKLSTSGESFKKAIRPEIIEHMANTPGTELYLKFVASGTEFDEIEQAIGILGNYPVWIMPMACTAEQQGQIDKHIATECIKRGYNFSYRTQNALWGNGIGT